MIEEEHQLSTLPIVNTQELIFGSFFTCATAEAQARVMTSPAARQVHLHCIISVLPDSLACLEFLKRQI